MVEVRIMFENILLVYNMTQETYDEFKKWIIYKDVDIMKKFQYSWFVFTDRNNPVYIFRDHIQVIRVV